MHNTYGKIQLVIILINYEIKRSNRKTLSLEITRDLKVLVRSPFFVNDSQIEKFVRTHEEWILSATEKVKAKNSRRFEPTNEEIAILMQKAKAYIPNRVAELSKLTNLTPKSVKITSARTRFGSCSAKNALCFSCLLMHYPLAAVDYVIIHELAHTVHHNHSKEFWNLVETLMPDYKECQRLLK